MRSAVPRAVAALALCAFAVGCGATPGGSGGNAAKTNKQEAAQTVQRPDPAKAGPVTLTVWDQEVRGGQSAEIQRLNAQFQAKYPNVKIKRVAKSFDDLNKTLKLAVSGSNAPDVVEANQGRAVMGALVKAGLLRPLDPYAKVFGWDTRYPKLLLDLNKFTPDGKGFGQGNLYGLSQMGEIVGVFYNKTKVPSPPTTLAAFEQSLAAAKKAGDIPIQFGNLDKWPGIHEYETTYAGTGGSKQAIRSFTFGQPDASFNQAQFRTAAATLQGWVRKGYLTPDFNGTGYDPAWQRFASGKGSYLIAGTWLVADLAKRMGNKVGFMTIPGQRADGQPAALGGESLPFGITSQSKHPAVAAAYIDFLTDANASKVLAQTGNLPAIPVGDQDIPKGLPAQVFGVWRKLGSADGLIPYLDYTTPTAGDKFAGSIQKMLALQTSPSGFTSDIQDQFKQFLSTNQ
jgi:raffinose/stachyose/melibiose transport system substrate-binding protein